MKSVKEFMEFTNLRGNVKNYALLLLLTSFVYCSIYTISMDMVYKVENSVVYYVALYIIILLSAYVYMIILFQFLKKKREDLRKIEPKKYITPLFLVQSLYFICMVGGGMLSYTLISANELSVNAYVVSPILMLFMLFYIPMQILSIFELYDGARNPFLIIKNSFMKILRHYQSVFYSLLAIGALCALFYSCMDAMFGIPTSLVPASSVIGIMTTSNPFMMLFQLMGSVFDNVSIALPAMLSLAYGIIMCLALTYYYMVMACIYDNDITV